jgi:uncharacterized protein YbbC (DUF1343 family)
VPTSPNIPTFEAALVYPGIGIVGETEVNEGRGTPAPFSLVGAPWLDGPSLAARLNALDLPGLKFEPVRYTPRSIPNIATQPRFEGTGVNGVRLIVTDPVHLEPLEAGIHVLAELAVEARSRNGVRLFGKLGMFHAIAGTKRLHRMLANGSSAGAIIAAWQDEVSAFKAKRAQYLLY